MWEVSVPAAKRAGEGPIEAVAYTRVSTKREEMISPELQAHEQDTYAARNGIRIVERVEDIALSGQHPGRVRNPECHQALTSTQNARDVKKDALCR